MRVANDLTLGVKCLGSCVVSAVGVGECTGLDTLDVGHPGDACQLLSVPQI